ncbi:MAG: MBL fold metallo-hydrolase [Chlamydiae bacterium CG10_big_fil_rev_8_21_14_0_10_42_34]|nr:MAG: MBL fold metallo-hydrolase [Chlamydiae bacterium CG10_big_fil_rev_8_21_14_0_10_42_34]
MRGTFLFLGTGASAGVPVIGCKCATCLSTSPKNKRFRPSGLISVGGTSLLIDIGPDFRSQALQFNVDSVDGLLLTHTHYDHIAGIDEVRVFNIRQKKELPCLLSKESFDELKTRYHYFFNKEGLSAKLDFQVLESDRGMVDFLGVKIGYCSFTQGGMLVTGFRVGDFAYISDIQKVDDSIFDSLKGVRTLVLSALKPEESHFHLSFDEAVGFSNRVGAKNTWLTHVGHFNDHDALNALLPSGVQVAYDGLQVEFLCEM